MKKRITLPALAAVALLLLAGCGSPGANSTPTPSPAALTKPDVEPLTDEEIAEIAAANDQVQLDRLLEMVPNAVVPKVERVRFVTTKEYGSVMAECMTAAGFDVSSSPDGGWGGMRPTDPAENDRYEIATYACAIQYPVDPRFTRPLNESQLTYLYNYWAGPLTECLERNGYTVTDPPPLETFIKHQGSWTPYANVSAGSLWQSLNQQCPQEPEGMYGEGASE